MNKKQEALRRGLRSFIEDTSRELADLEGRESAPTPHPDAPRDEDSSASPQTLAPPTAEPPTVSPRVVPERPRSDPPPPPDVLVEVPTPRGAVAESGTSEAVPEGPPTGADAPPLEASTPAKPARRPRAPARRRPRTSSGPKLGGNGVGVEQAQARKGVCFAYFLNHECWRVPEAYCNSALQVCITRECPVYHLHKDVLERRFARKFKHFW